MECKDFVMTITNSHSNETRNIRMRFDAHERCWWSMLVISNQDELWMINVVSNKLIEICKPGQRHCVEFTNNVLSFKLLEVR